MHDIEVKNVNGGGKTTLIKTMIGLINLDKGEIKIRKGAKLGYVSQFTSFDKTFPIKVLDVILMGRLVSSMKIFHHYSNKDTKKARNIMYEFASVFGIIFSVMGLVFSYYFNISSGASIILVSTATYFIISMLKIR